ncbi:hypothetical protein STANM309S_03382 [Streptomyces tanashiensis]
MCSAGFAKTGSARWTMILRSVIVRYIGTGVGITAIAPPEAIAEATAKAVVRPTETLLRFTTAVTSTRSPGSSRGWTVASRARRRLPFMGLNS